MTLPLLRRPGGYVPLLLSAAALTLIVGYLAFHGVTEPPPGVRPDEGTAAHVFQLLMAAQLPVMGWFAVSWLPREPREALKVLVLQAVAAAVPVATILVLEM
ncbi:MAG: hypothetical protein AMXMBFR53_20250 [Gemmatimonadota bacterium]